MNGTRRGFGCLLLLALPFAAVGLVVLLLAGQMLWRWVEAREWQEVPARLLTAELIENRGSDSTTYEITASYEYTFENRTYQGERVGLGTGADNIGSFHQDKYAELQQQLDAGGAFRCYVDPDDPSRSLLYRDLRWGLLAFMSLFGLVFGGVGLGVAWVTLRGRRRQREVESRVALSPSEPWRWRPEWTDGRITASGRAQFLLPALIALFWNLISMPLLFLVREELLEQGNRLALLVLVFPAVGVGLLVWAGRAWIRWRKFGDSELELSTFPGVIGGRLAGRILSSTDLQPVHGFRLVLDNIHRQTTGSGKNRRTQERILWQDEQYLQRQSERYDPSRSEIPVDFRIPYEAAASEERGDDDEILWRLRVEAEVPGVDYSAWFEVPVFRTSESSAAASETETDERDRSTRQDAPPPDLASHGIDSQLLANGGRRLTFRAARHKGVALALTGFLVLWLGFNYLLIVVDAPLLFPIIWGLFSLLLLFGVLDLWFERRTIDIHSDHFTLAGGILGLGKSQEIARSSIEEIKPVRGMQAGGKLFYRLQIRTRDGSHHIAATKLDHLILARHLVELMQE